MHKYTIGDNEKKVIQSSRRFSLCAAQYIRKSSFLWSRIYGNWLHINSRVEWRHANGAYQNKGGTSTAKPLHIYFMSQFSVRRDIRATDTRTEQFIFSVWCIGFVPQCVHLLKWQHTSTNQPFHCSKLSSSTINFFWHHLFKI